MGPKFFLSVPQMVLELQKKLFCFLKVTDPRNLALLKPMKFQNLGDVTELTIKQFPQSILRWGFHMICYKDLGFQLHQI